MAEELPEGGRSLESLTKLERKWLSRRMCGFCEIPLLSRVCGAYSGEYILPVIEGVREVEETIDLGPECDMDERRAKSLAEYKPRKPQDHNHG